MTYDSENVGETALIDQQPSIGDDERNGRAHGESKRAEREGRLVAFDFVRFHAPNIIGFVTQGLAA